MVEERNIWSLEAAVQDLARSETQQQEMENVAQLQSIKELALTRQAVHVEWALYPTTHLLLSLFGSTSGHKTNFQALFLIKLIMLILFRRLLSIDKNKRLDKKLKFCHTVSVNFMTMTKSKFSHIYILPRVGGAKSYDKIEVMTKSSMTKSRSDCIILHPHPKTSEREIGESETPIRDIETGKYYRSSSSSESYASPEMDRVQLDDDQMPINTTSTEPKEIWKFPYPKSSGSWKVTKEISDQMAFELENAGENTSRRQYAKPKTTTANIRDIYKIPK
ncbi:hypothetical protein BD560DRAFT_419493 [Blakeslea trispora]|nr:hypothetical protein BD560DRAFT_419493 [Blakeslea trispora]